MSQANSVIWTKQDQRTYELNDCGIMHRTCTRVNLDWVPVLKVLSGHRVQFLTKKLSTTDNPLVEGKLVFSLNILATLWKGPMSISIYNSCVHGQRPMDGEVIDTRGEPISVVLCNGFNDKDHLFE